MEFKIILLQDLLDSLGDLETDRILKTFKSIPSDEINDVECFLHDKAIQFEKSSISTTHLVFKNSNLVGYFSLANKKLIIGDRNYRKLSNSQKRKLCKKGEKLENGSYYINSYLIGQLGKNYSNVLNGNAISGNELLTLAYNTLLKVKSLISARYVWLECEDNPKLINFYENFGFSLIPEFESTNGLKVLIMKLK